MKLTKKPHERDFSALAMFKPDPEQVFIDVGANRGLAILSVSLFPNIKNKIIGFEPNPMIFNKIEKNYFIFNKRVTIHHFGLGDHNTELTLFVPFYRKWMFDGLSSFHYEEAKNWLTQRLWRFNPNKLSIKKLDCKVRKLDDFNLNPYFIKIDVQGYEFNVLKGSENTIKKYHPILLIECITKKIILFLEQYDYLFFSYRKGKFIKGTGSLNTFCMTEEKYHELMT